MKLSERVRVDGDSVTVHRQFANSPYITKAAQLREAGVGQTGEHRLAGIVPVHVLNEWLREAGVDWSDTHAARDVVRRKLLSGEFDKLRVWDGRY